MSPVAAGGVVAPDYYAIGKSVAGTIAKVSRPLTREQRTALTGALSVWLDAADQRTAAAQAEADRLRELLGEVRNSVALGKTKLETLGLIDKGAYQ